MLDECALEHLKPLFVASGAFETDSGDRTARQLDNLGAPAFEAGSGNRATWLLDDLRARACAPDQLERVARQLLRALTSERAEIESIVSSERVNAYTNYRSAFTEFRVPDMPRAMQDYEHRSKASELGWLAKHNWRHAYSPRPLNILAGFSH